MFACLWKHCFSVGTFIVLNIYSASRKHALIVRIDFDVYIPWIPQNLFGWPCPTVVIIYFMIQAYSKEFCQFMELICKHFLQTEMVKSNDASHDPKLHLFCSLCVLQEWSWTPAKLGVLCWNARRCAASSQAPRANLPLWPAPPVETCSAPAAGASGRTTTPALCCSR